MRVAAFIGGPIDLHSRSAQIHRRIGDVAINLSKPKGAEPEPMAKFRKIRVMNSKMRLVLRAGSTLAFLISAGSSALRASDPSPQTAPNGASAPADQASTPSGTSVHVAKPYVLFMGADVALEKDKTFDPIDEVADTVIVVTADGKPVNVPKDRNNNLQVREDLKIASSSVEMSDLKTDRAYSQLADPFRKIEGYNTAASGAVNVEDLARGALVNDHTKLDSTAAGSGPAAAQAQQILAQDQAAVDSATTQTAEAIDMVGRGTSKELGAESGGTFDAIRVSFAVTPKSDLAKPYLAIIAHIKDPAGKPDQELPWIHLESLGPMAAGVTRKVNVYEEGLPPGYTLGKCEVHIYDGRSELATNLSSNRAELSRDEMLDFRVIRYIAANSERTLPAMPAMFVSDLRSSLSQDQLNQTCYVRVAKDGRVAATFIDKEGTQPLQDQALNAALKGLRFKPAIESGKPVEAVVAIRLGKLGGH